MEQNFFLEGIIIGFLIAAPVGPIGVLCIQRSFSKGAWSGFFTGLGAATADTFYGAVAAFGLTFISNFLLHQKLSIQIIGVFFLIYIGLKTFHSKPAVQKKIQQNNKNLFHDYFSTLGLTLTNPMTIISFMAVFTNINLNSSGNYFSATLIVFGVFCGSAFWWLILSNSIGLLRKKSSKKFFASVNKISGIIILGFAAIIFIHIIKG